jgi:hypothetical protein
VESNRFRNVTEKVAKFVRTSIAGPFSVNPASGFNSAGFDCEMSFSLSQTLVYFGGTLASTVSNTGASDFIALFDQWRIDAVELCIMYGANAFAPVPGTGAQNPVLMIVFDPSDTSVISLPSILQYNDVKMIQLGNQRLSNGYTLMFKPTPLLTAGGAVSTVPSSAPWISKDQPSVAHFGVKMFLDSIGSTLATAAGNIEFYVKYHLSMRLPQ